MMWLIGVNNLRAFTLVEIMISVLILGVGLASVANSYILALRGANSAQNNIVASMIAKEKFENLEFVSLNGALSSSPAPEIIKSSTKDYNYQQKITPMAASADLAKYLVSACLTVSWSEKNYSKNVTLASYLLKQK